MFGLSFLSPLFLVGAAAAAIPIAIHLFYRRTEPVIDFAAMRYLRGAPVEQSRHRRLRELILLALRVTALVLLALAFARPFLSGSAAALTAPATVVLVDTSLSLSTPGEFARVRALAEEAIRGAPPDHATAVLSFANTATVVAPLSLDRAGALAAIGTLEPGAGATRYQAALRRAAEEMAGRAGRIVVVSDLQESGWDAADSGGVPGRIEVEIVEAGGAATNRAVTSLRIDGTEAVAIVRSFSPRAEADQVVFTLGDRGIAAVPVTLEAGGSAEARAPLPAGAAGSLAASITDPEGYAADNVRYAVVDSTDATSILAVTASGHPSEALYLERALGVAEGAGGFGFRVIGGRAFSDLDAEALGRVDAVVVLGTRGLERRGRENLAGFVRSGGGVLLTAGPDVEEAVLRDSLNGLVRTAWRSRDDAPMSLAPDDSRHPIFRLFGGAGSLGNVNFQRASLIDVPDTGEVLARYSDGSPALVEERTAGGRVLVFASDLNAWWNDFPIQPAFVPFVHETLRYLASTPAGRSEYLVGDLPGEAGRTPGVVSLTPVGRTFPGPPGVPDDARPPRARGARPAAVNVDPRESDPARMTAEAFQAGISRLHDTAGRQAPSEAGEREDGQRLWQYALLLMVVSLAAEGLLGRRLG
jgi:hypothetical protein